MNFNTSTISRPVIFLSFILFSSSWISFGLNNNDSQLWPLFGSFLLIFFFYKNIVFERFFLIAAMYSLIVISYQQISFAYPVFVFLRIFASFLIFFSVFFATSLIPLKYLQFCKKTIVFINYLWVSFGVLQYFIPSLRLLIGRSSVTRGVTSFAAEPSFFSMFLIFSSLAIYVLSGFNFSKNYRLHVLNIFSIVFLASSMVGIVFSAVSLLGIIFIPFIFRLFIFFKLKNRNFYILSILSSTSVFLILYLQSLTRLSELTRLGRLATLIFESPMNILSNLFLVDASSNGRLFHTIAPYNVLIHNYGLPSTLNGFSDIGPFYAELYNGYFWHNITSGVMTWHGEIFLSLGIIGVLLILLIAIRPNVHSAAYPLIFTLPILLHSTIPIAFPMVPILISLIHLESKFLSSFSSNSSP